MEIDKSIELLLSKLGLTIEKVWPWFIQKQYIDVWDSLFDLVMSVLLFMSFFVLCWKKNDYFARMVGEDEFTFWGVMCVLSGIGVFVFGIYILVDVVDLQREALDLFNIEHAALQDLMKTLKTAL